MSIKKRDILVLDDQDYWRAVIESAIKEDILPDCEIHIATTYGEALALIKERDKENMFQIALLDYSLSESEKDATKTGYNVAVTLRAKNSKTAIYLVSYYSESYIRTHHKDYEDQRIHFIPKDAELTDTIVREIRESLEELEKDET